MLMISFATRTDSTLDPLTERALALAKEFMELTGRFTLVHPLYVDSPGRCRSLGALSNTIDFIKPLQWIPTSMRSRGRRLHDELLEVYGVMTAGMKARMDAGEDVPDCLVKTLILTQEEENLDWEDMCMLAAAFSLGGVAFV